MISNSALHLDNTHSTTSTACSLEQHVSMHKKEPHLYVCKTDEVHRKDILHMNTSLSSRSLEVKYAGVAIEYGTLTLLMNAII